MRPDNKNRTPTELQEIALSEKLRQRFPYLYFDCLALIDTKRSRIIIDDVSYRARESIAEEIEALALSARGWTAVYDARTLAAVLGSKLQSLDRAIGTSKTLIVFPGEGAKVPRDLLPSSLFEDAVQIGISATRTIDPRNGGVKGIELGGLTEMRTIIKRNDVRFVVAIDDTVATAATLTALWEASQNRNVDWFGGSLMMRSPVQNSANNRGVASGVPGYTSMITPVVYQGTHGIPAVNSLSTLVGTSRKSELVRAKYLDNYVEDRETFLAAVQSMRQALTSGNNV